MKRSKGFYRGCLIGGAIGDAMGWPVEFSKFEDIKNKYGKNGVTNLTLGTNGKAEITDDTQMTLFTAEGILRAEKFSTKGGVYNPSLTVYYAYLYWIHTQGYPKNNILKQVYESNLVNIKELHEKRAPGLSCLSALLSGKQGTVKEPINNSKGCGGVMRVAPIGLLYTKKRAFQVAIDCAAITHGHPLGYLPAGALAYIIASIIEGRELEISVEGAISELKDYRGSAGCIRLIIKAVALAKSNKDPVEAIAELGEGWVGEEALAISVYCALKYESDFRKAIIASVNHDGDSDSTGAITGNILGAYLGLNSIPQLWVDSIELADVINEISDQLLISY